VDLSIELLEILTGCYKVYAQAVGQQEDLDACFLLDDDKVRGPPLTTLGGQIA
jgi:hypothetical protein